MIAVVRGKLMEKFPRDKKTRDGKDYQTFHGSIYQTEDKKTVTVKLEKETYNKLEEGKPVEVVCNIGAFQGNNGIIQYASEIRS